MCRLTPPSLEKMALSVPSRRDSQSFASSVRLPPKEAIAALDRKTVVARRHRVERADLMDALGDQDARHRVLARDIRPGRSLDSTTRCVEMLNNLPIRLAPACRDGSAERV